MGKNTHIFILADYIDLHLTTVENRINRNGNTRGFWYWKRERDCVRVRVSVSVWIRYRRTWQAHFDARTCYKKLPLARACYTADISMPHMNESRVFYYGDFNKFLTVFKWFLLVSKNKNNTTKCPNQKWSKTKYMHTHSQRQRVSERYVWKRWTERERNRKVVVMCI